MLKNAIHKTLRKFGYDIVALRNLEDEVERRVRDRDLAKIASFNMLREKRSKAASACEGKGGLTWVSRDEITSVASAEMQDVNTLLDIGCAFRPQRLFEARVHICCEPYGEYMDRLIAETIGENRFIYLQRDIEGVCDLFPHQTVDSAYLCDVIEHVDRDVAVRCLSRLKSMVTQQIIIFTPIGYMPQDPDEQVPATDPWGMGGVSWQKHRSGWVPEDFPAEDGWTVVACRNFHQEDGYGRPLEEPFGAMWAIWNGSGSTRARWE